MKSSVFLPVLVPIFLCILAATCLGQASGPSQKSDEIKTLSRRASALRRKAMDLRVMSLNALKNADAERGKAHELLVEAMTDGDREKIGKARDTFDKSADDLKRVIESVDDVIELSMKAGMDALAAEEMCKTPLQKRDEGKESLPDRGKIESKLDSAGKSLSKAEEIAEKLRKEWLEPFFASTTSTSSTTTTTKAAPLPPVK